MLEATMSLTFVQAEMQVVSKGDDNPRSRSEWLKMGEANNMVSLNCTHCPKKPSGMPS